MNERWSWKKVASARERYLSERARDDYVVDDLFEQARIAVRILSAIESFLVRDKASSDSLLIALHGRHGQGKSAVVEKVVQELDFRRLVVKRKNIAVRSARFNCANYSSKDLSENFDFFLESYRGWPLLVPTLVILTFLLVGTVYASEIVAIFGFSEWSEVAERTVSGLLGASAAFTLIGLRPARLLVRDLWRRLRTGKGVLSTLRFAFDRMFIPIDVLFVDDLDRASVDQQKALLQSLKRHRADFSGAVLVAFDDSPLLSAIENKHEVSELLTKVFDLSFRLSPMNARDAALMAHSFASELAEINPGCEIARLFEQPMVVGDLARVFVLHGNASARFARKLINNVYSAALVGEFGRSTDVSALIRLHGVFQYVPALEAELDPIVNYLLEASDSDLAEFIKARFGAEIPAVFSHRLQRFIDRTKHMQPSNVGWMRLLRVWRNRPIGAEGDIRSPAEWDPAWTRSWALNDAFLASRDAPAERAQVYRSITETKNSFLRFNDLELRSDGVGVAQLAKTKPTSDHLQFWTSLALRLKVHDDDFVDLLSEAERTKLLTAHQSQPVGHLLASSRSGLKLSNISDLFRHNLLSKDVNIKHRLEFELDEFLKQPNDGLRLDLRLPRPMDGADVSALNAAWPSFRYSADEDAPHRHFEQLSLLLNNFTFDARVLPSAHKEFLRFSIEHKQYELAWNCFSALLPTQHLEDSGFFWPVGTADELWESLDSRSKSSRGFVQFLAARSAVPWQDFSALWLLSRSGHRFLQDRQIEYPELKAEVLPTSASQEQSPVWLESLQDLAQFWPSLEIALQKAVNRNS